MGVASPGPFPWWMDVLVFLIERPWSVLLGVLGVLGVLGAWWGVTS